MKPGEVWKVKPSIDWNDELFITIRLVKYLGEDLWQIRTENPDAVYSMMRGDWIFQYYVREA